MAIVGKTMFPLSNGIANITAMKARYDKLQTQLSSGDKASNLAEFQRRQFGHHSLRQRIARMVTLLRKRARRRIVIRLGDPDFRLELGKSLLAGVKISKIADHPHGQSRKLGDGNGIFA